MKIEDPLRNFNESLEIVKESVEKGVLKRQRNIGFNVSVGSVDLLESFLHKEQIINPGTILKHNWFSSARHANEKLDFDFPEKEKIINLIVEIEEKRNLLCYGKPQAEETIEEIINKFYKLINIFESLGLNIRGKNE